MKHRCAAFLAALLAIAGLAFVGASEAGAANCSTGDWHAGFGMTSYQFDYGAGQGSFYYSPVNGHYYLLVPRSTFESSWGVTAGATSRFDTWMGFPCTGPSGNQFDLANVVYPWGNSGGVDYTKYDMALIDFGTSNVGAVTDIVHNYCHPYPGCEGMWGGTDKSVGTALGQGSAMSNVSNVAGGAYIGLPVCTSGPWGGTSCGTVSSASVHSYNGYSQWTWNVTGMGNCKAGGFSTAAGALASDHGSPVYYSVNATQLSMVGMVSGFQNQQAGAGNACWDVGESYGDIKFIPWTSVDAGFPGYQLAPVV